MGKTITVRNALNQALREELIKDESVFIMGEEVAEYQGAYKITENLWKEFGDKRIIDTPISEHGFAGIAVGAAFAGLRPIVEFMTFNFAMQAMDHIINSAAKTCYMSGGQVKCPIVFRGPNGAASQVGAQHSQCYASWFGHVPGLIVLAPYSAVDAKYLLKQAVSSENPVIFLEHEMLYGEAFEMDESQAESVEIGKAKIEKSGDDLTVVGYSISLLHIAKAEVMAKKAGINIEIINLHTIRPLDMDTIIKSVKKTNKILIVEEGWGHMGVAAEIISQVVEQAFDYLDMQPERITGKDTPTPYAKVLEENVLPSAGVIYEKIVQMVGK